MNSLLISTIASAFLAGFVGLFGNQARKARPITGGRHNPLAHGVRIALTDDELIKAASRNRPDFGSAV